MGQLSIKKCFHLYEVLEQAKLIGMVPGSDGREHLASVLSGVMFMVHMLAEVGYMQWSKPTEWCPQDLQLLQKKKRTVNKHCTLVNI